MTTVVTILVLTLFTNAVISFFIFFFLRAKVILTVFGASDWNDAHVP